MSTDLNNQDWRKSFADEQFLISTIPNLIDRAFIQTAFASEDTYWAKPLPDDQIETLLAKSITLGLYKILPDGPPTKSADSPSSPRTPSPFVANEPTEKLTQIGMARLISDHVTTSYLTDVYVLPEHRGNGLAKWLIACCNDVFNSHAAMRRTFLVANPDVGKKFYARELGMWDVSEEKEKLACMTRRFFKMD